MIILFHGSNRRCFYDIEITRRMLTNDELRKTIRLVGIDAPETSKKKNQVGQSFSRRSAKYLAGLVLNRSVDVKSYGTDRYGRILGVVFVGEKKVNVEMVNVGLAEVYRGKSPGDFIIAPYFLAEAEARKAGIGIWSLGDNYLSPKQSRKKLVKRWKK